MSLIFNFQVLFNKLFHFFFLFNNFFNCPCFIHCIDLMSSVTDRNRIIRMTRAECPSHSSRGLPQNNIIIVCVHHFSSHDFGYDTINVVSRDSKQKASDWI